jgi:hypothetical protein
MEEKKPINILPKIILEKENFLKARLSNEARTILKIDYQKFRQLTGICVCDRGSYFGIL